MDCVGWRQAALLLCERKRQCSARTIAEALLVASAVDSQSVRGVKGEERAANDGQTEYSA